MQFRHITTNPEVLNGKPVIIGTRISVAFILELVASGGSVKEIAKKYPQLSEEAVKDAILYAMQRMQGESRQDSDETETPLTAKDLHALQASNPALDFLEAEEEDIYSDEDLKVKF